MCIQAAQVLDLLRHIARALQGLTLEAPRELLLVPHALLFRQVLCMRKSGAESCSVRLSMKVRACACAGCVRDLDESNSAYMCVCHCALYAYEGDHACTSACMYEQVYVK